MFTANWRQRSPCSPRRRGAARPTQPSRRSTAAAPLKAASDAYRIVYPQMSTAAADRAAAEQPSRKAL